MPWRFIIEGSWNPARDDKDGFFATRRVSAGTEEDAAEQALTELYQEWLSAPCVPNGSRGLNLVVLDSWRIGRTDWFRAPNGGHGFHVNGARAEMALLEAKVARAPKTAAIWRIAAGE